MEDVYNDNDLIKKTVQEIITLTPDRKKIMVFTCGIKHCEAIHNCIISHGLTSGYIHSKQSKEANNKIISDFKNGKIKFLVNVDKLTEGFNEKAIDCICMVRATKSPGLYSQIVGRGLRIHPDKQNCLYLDFGNNILTHGPIDKIFIQKKKDGTSEVMTQPMKACPQCEMLQPISVKICENCGFVFVDDTPKHDDKASNADIISKWKAPDDYPVTDAYYSKHSKLGKPDSLKVDYFNDYDKIGSEWVCVLHEGYAGKKAWKWMRDRSDITPDEIDNIDDLIRLKNRIKIPTQISIDYNDKFPRVTKYVFGERPESTIKYEPKEKESESFPDNKWDNLVDIW
jgi:DNA repair protein RadD